jgi:hypothetical protein
MISAEDHKATLYTTTTTGSPVQQILFTSSPDVVSVTPPNHRRNLQTTRFPTGRTSFSTSTPPYADTGKDNDEENSHKDEDKDTSSHSEKPANNDKDDHDHDDDKDDHHDQDDDKNDDGHDDDKNGNGHDDKSNKNDGDDNHEEDDNDHENTNDDESREAKLTLTTRYEEPVTSSTVLSESRERVTKDFHKSEESQLNKMLLDEIPPHHSPEVIEQPPVEDSSEEENSHTPALSSEFNLPTTTVPTPMKESVRIDPLARLIKNLAPKWGRNRTVETTTLSSGSHRYDFTISSKENNSKTSKESTNDRIRGKYKSRETTTKSSLLVTPEPSRNQLQTYKPTEFGAKLGYGTSGPVAIEPVSILNTIKSPDLSRRKDQEVENSDGVGQFLDVLVGSEDHKTLVTKQTEDGIVTSAILPPWFNNNQENAISNNKNATKSDGATERTGNVSNEDSDSNSGSGSNEETNNENGPGSGESSVFGGLFDLFRKSIPSSPSPGISMVENDPKRIVLKRPGGELIAQGTSHVAHSSEGNSNNNGLFGGSDNNKNKPAMSFRDLIRSAAPGLLSSTTIATIDPAVVTDDISPANSHLHYGTPDGGTNIYGYYPDDDDKEADKTVEHVGLQSESLSDEIMESVQRDPHPSHSIEVQVPDGSSEIVIEQENVSADGNKFGETQAQSENHGLFVSPPTFHGGGIRRPLEEDDDLLEHGDLEMKSSEHRPVYASPQNGSMNAINITEDHSNHKYSYVDPSKVVSEEVSDNSAEENPGPSLTPDAGNVSNNYHEKEGLSQFLEGPHASVEESNTPLGSGSGSYESDTTGTGSGLVSQSHELPPNENDNKWSERDKFVSVEENNPTDPVGQVVNKAAPEIENTNNVLERKPVVQLDEKLYPDSTDTTTGEDFHQSISEESSKVQEIFPVGYAPSSSTTERPSDESTIAEPEKSEEPNKSQENKGFVPPTPVSFHDNKYTFQAPPSESIYQSKDGWRPVVYNDKNDENEGDQSSRPLSTRPPFWRTRQPILIPTRSPTHPTTTQQLVSPPNNAVDQPNSNQNLEEDEEYEDEEEEEVQGEENADEAEDGQVTAQDQETNNYSWGNRERLVQQPNLPNNNKNIPPQSTIKFPQDETQENFERDLEPQPQHLQVAPQHQLQQPLPIQSNDQQAPSVPQPQQIPNQQNPPPPPNPHPNQIHQQQQPHPIQHNQQVQRHPQQPPPRPIPQHQQRPTHHVTHQQRQQFLFQNNHNPNIDRSKYMMRPAPPPIVMRRAPIQNMPYLPNRDGPGRQGLIPQVQQPSQFVSDAPPTEFQQHPHYALRRRFKTLGARPRSNLNWPEDNEQDKASKVVQVAERRTG